MENIAGSITPTATLPDQAKTEYTEQDYREALQFIAMRWNIQPNNYTILPNIASDVSVTASTGYAYEYLRNAAYIYGAQITSEYGFFVKDDLGNVTRVPMFRGMDVAKYYFHVDGEWRDSIEPLPRMIGVEAMSKNAKSIKKTKMDMIKFRADMANEIAQMQYMTGLGFEPVEGIDYDNEFEVKKKLENFQEGMEIAYQALARNSCYANRYFKKLTKAGNYAFIGGLAMVKVYEHRGRIKWDIVTPERAIFDVSKQDDQHEDDDYAGELYELSVVELLDRFEWTEEEIKDLKAAANDGTLWARYNTFTAYNGLLWWNNQSGVPKVTCVEGQWRSLEKRDGEWVEILREGVLIGNKWIKNTKISDSQVYDKYDKSRKKLKYIICTPNSILGTVQGVVGMIKRYCDLKDAIVTKMIALTSSAIGKSYVFNANKFPEGMREPDIIAKLKQTNIIVQEGADIDDTPDIKNQRMIEPIDMTLDPSLPILVQQIQYFDNMIADIINIPAGARGQQANYQSKDVVASNIAQSNKGMKWFYSSMMQFTQRILEYSADLAKLRFPLSAEGRDSLALQVGDTMTQLFSVEEIRKMQFEDFLLYLLPNNIASEEDKAKYESLALQLASAGQFSMLDFLKLDTLESKTEMVNYFEYVEIKKEMKAAAEQQAAREQALQAAQINAQAQENIAATQTEGKLIDREMQNEMKAEEMAMKQQPPMQ